MDTQEEKIKSTTNSPMGSYHWFHTLMSRHLHVGEFLSEKIPNNEEMVKSWGRDLYETSKELLAGYKYINQTDWREQAKKDIEHIFESGANETRVMEMLERFMNKK